MLKHKKATPHKTVCPKQICLLISPPKKPCISITLYNSTALVVYSILYIYSNFTGTVILLRDLFACVVYFTQGLFYLDNQLTQ